MDSQHAEILRLLSPEIEFVRSELAAGRPPSEIADSLHARRFGSIQVLFIFREATGAPLRDLKAFGQWWGPQGVTDRKAFDDRAREVLGKLGIVPGTGG